MHAKRVESLANATLGVVRTGSLAVSTIGHGLALARGLTTKHAIKQSVEQANERAVNLSIREGMLLRHHRVLRIVIVGKTIRGLPVQDNGSMRFGRIRIQTGRA
jgi:hypothetical protein